MQNLTVTLISTFSLHDLNLNSRSYFPPTSFQGTGEEYAKMVAE